jgi:hypothetical protein
MSTLLSIPVGGSIEFGSIGRQTPANDTFNSGAAIE